MIIIKRAIICFILLDNWLHNILKKYILKTRYKITGKCRMCGNCCKEILLCATPAQCRNILFSTVATKWIEWIFDFTLLKIDTKEGYFVFSCKKQLPDGTCGNYFWRPSVCRNFPLVDYFKEPVLLPGCGFKAELR